MKYGFLLPEWLSPRRPFRSAAILAIVGMAGAILFAWSGLYNVAASKGHWRVVDLFLRLAMRSSVQTHAMGLQAPPLSDPALLDRGAGHYAIGCAPCHGAPGKRGHIVPANMLPSPPSLSRVVETWAPEELFWIVKHGLKYTSMPAWPAQSRDDEVWAVTAFLRRLPELAPADYFRLSRGVEPPHAPVGGPAAPQASAEFFNTDELAALATCVRCHGGDGPGRPSGAFPRLDIQGAAYLRRALEDYAAGRRPSGIMRTAASSLDATDIQRLAGYYAAATAPQTPRPEIKQVARDLLELGRQIAEAGIPARRIPACGACHGLEQGPTNPLYPALTGQYASFSELQLRLWSEGRRGSGRYSAIMQAAVRSMTPRDMRAVALYYERLPSSPAAVQAAQPALPQSSP